MASGLKLVRCDEKENDPGFVQKPLTRAESKKAKGVAERGLIVRDEPQPKEKAGDIRHTVCNRKIAKAIRLFHVGEGIEKMDLHQLLIVGMVKTLQKWYSRYSMPVNGEPDRISEDDAMSLMVRLFRLGETAKLSLGETPISLGEYSPRVLSDRDWKAHQERYLETYSSDKPKKGG